VLYPGRLELVSKELSMIRILIPACALVLFTSGCKKTEDAKPAAPAAPVAGQPASQPGKSLDKFDPCSVVSDSEYVQALMAEAGDPSAMGTINATHAPVDGANTGLPGAKACKLSYKTTDSAGRVSQGGDPVVVTFDLYSNLHDVEGNDPRRITDYQVSGAEAFEGPGDAGNPHLTKNGYLFRMSGNSDLKLLKVIALGVAKRL
jgi:hypothetical protein